MSRLPPQAADSRAQYGIFLSHAYGDRERIARARNRIAAEGYSIHVDWIEDADLDRGAADRGTAERLRQRMRRSGTLFYAVSTNARASRWMPWELGCAGASSSFPSTKGRATIPGPSNC